MSNAMYFFSDQGNDRPHTLTFKYLMTFQWRSKVPKSGGGGGGGGGGAHSHVIYVPSVKNQYKRVVIGYMVIY